MASLDVGTEAINRADIVARYHDYVQASANSGISWGTNAYPFAEWDWGAEFGGPTTGRGQTVNDTSIAAGGLDLITAANIYNVLLADTQTYTNIRNIRARLFVTGDGGNTGSRPTAGTVYDATATAHLTAGYRQSFATYGGIEVHGGNPDIVSGAITSAGNLEALFWRLRQRMLDYRGVVAFDHEVSVCHASCHTSCHSSRGRR